MLLEKAAIAMSLHGRAIAHFGEAVTSEPDADFQSLEVAANAARIEREEAKERYELHVATQQKEMTSVSGYER